MEGRSTWQPPKKLTMAINTLKKETLKKVSFSPRRLTTFAAIFGLLGVYIVLHSFAATPQDPVIAAAGDIACDPYVHNSDGTLSTPMMIHPLILTTLAPTPAAQVRVGTLMMLAAGT
jgi:hypothetical protein